MFIFISKTEVIFHQNLKTEVNFTRTTTRKLSQQSLNNKMIKIYITFSGTEANHYTLISSNRHSALMSFVMHQLQIPRKIVMQLNFNFFPFISSSVRSELFYCMPLSHNLGLRQFDFPELKFLET